MAHRKILVIDNDRESVGPLTAQLEQAGYQVEVATDGQAGLQAFADLKPDLVVLEAMLPKLHGLKVCEEIKKNPDGLATPIVMTTAGGRDRDFMSEAGTIYGYQEYLEKPLSPERVVAACNRIIGSTGAAVVEPALPSLTTEDVMARLDADVSTVRATVQPVRKSGRGRWAALALLFVAGATAGFFVLRPTPEIAAPRVQPSPQARTDRAPRTTPPVPSALTGLSASSGTALPASVAPQPPVEAPLVEAVQETAPPRPVPQKPQIKRRVFERKPAIPVDLEFAGIALDPLDDGSVDAVPEDSIQMPALIDSLGSSLHIAPPKPQPGTLFALDEVDVAPGLVERREPIYPAVATRLGQQGDVTVNVLIDHHGAIEDVELIRGIDRSKLNDAAMTAVRSWRYTPALKDGVAVRVWLPVEFEFRLSR